jgi:hypothetical protein
VLAVASASDTGTVDGTTGIAVGIGFLLIPVSFLIVAWMTRHDRLVMASGLATALALVIWTWVPFVIGELVSPFAAAVGCGGAIALRSDPPQRLSHRLIGVGILTAYVFIVVRVAFGFALLATPFLPLATVLAADWVSERLAAR